VAEVVVFHHALGLTDPIRRFAAALGDAGHSVHTPDLFDGRTFDVGFSLGVLSAQSLAQTRPGASGAVLC
jgi:dienelactone hydrolase